jgi:GNAT superfamily N-acetyltransferase
MTKMTDKIFEVLEATWPAAAQVEAGPWTLREGRGGGKRVSAATLNGVWAPADLGAAESAMRLMGQDPLFQIRPGEEALDAALAERGYELVDTTHLWVAPIGQFVDRKLPRVTAFTIWEPLEIMKEIWAEGGITEARLRVMDRCKLQKTSMFGRVSDRPGGAGFCALYDGTAMVHALEVREEHRGKGMAGWLMRAAGLWAERKGAHQMAVACTQANVAANALYASLGMELVGQYHYRILKDPEGDLS